MRIVVSGGGTVGHVSPVLATVDALRELDNALEVCYIGQRGGMEDVVVRRAGLRFVGVFGGKIRRVPHAGILGNLSNIPMMARNLWDIAGIIIGTVQCVVLVWRYRPEVIFNKVGPAGLPVGLAAAILRIPMVLHEPDVIPGWANRFLSRWAVRIATGFPVEQQRDLPVDKLVFTGTPVQAELLKGSRKRALSALHFSANKPVVLVVGGSLGATAINTAVLNLLPDVLKKAQVYHVAGAYDFERVRNQAASAGIAAATDGSLGYRLVQFLQVSEMADAYAAADIVVARAGANTIAELALTHQAVILIPNRYAAAHQIANAEALHQADAAVVVGEGSEELGAALAGLLDNASRRRTLARRIAAFGYPEAACKLADVLVQVRRET